jgi:AraC-like DNA-binding protein
MSDPALSYEHTSPLAQGRYLHEVRPGMTLVVTDMMVEQPLVYNSTTFPALCMSVVLEGYATNNNQGIDGGFCPDEVWISSIGECVPTSMTILPGHPVRVVELLLTQDWIKNNETLMGEDLVFDNMARAMREPMQVRRRPLDARLRQLAWNALNPHVPKVFLDYHVEACALGMFSILTENFQADAERPAMDKLSARSQQRIMAIRLHIESDLSAITSIAKLAQHFATSQSTLKRDFQLAFGISVRDYLLERRMLCGRNAIVRDRLTIAEAAYRAGYEHPANFTAAFRKFFGYPPSHIKP